MKIKLFFLTLCANLFFAQNAELFSNNWYIAKIVTNGQTETTPIMDNSLIASTFVQNGTNFTFNSRYFNVAATNISFSTTSSSFVKDDGACTLADYWGTNRTAVQEYDHKNCMFYIGNPSTPAPIGTVYNYQIISNGTAKTLIITNSATGTQIFYNNSFLSTKEIGIKKSFKFYPNPAKNSLIIENIDKNLRLKIFEMSGKLVYETITSRESSKIDVSDFQKGQYILMIENFKPEFFIKE